MPGIKLEILVKDKRWQRIPKLALKLEKAAKAAFDALPKRLRIAGTVTILLTNDAAIRRLNRNFRGIDRPTNVLSFPQFEPRELTKMGKKGGKLELGDIALAYQYMVDEANKDHKILINHASHLLIHGILHILGYDHMTDADAHKMERLEKKVMADLGLPDPYKQPMEQKARTRAAL